MKALIGFDKITEVDNITIKGAYDTPIASFVTYTAPLATTDLQALLKVRQAGFSFDIVGELVYITSRKHFTEFV